MPANIPRHISKPVGVHGLRRYGGYVYEEFLPELRWPMAAKIYQEMADNDPVVGAILYLAEMLIRGVDWEVEPASESQTDIDAASFLQSCMHDMEMTWADTICEVLSMFTYGFSFHEVLYKIRRGQDETSPKYKSRYNDGKIGWRAMPGRAQSTLHMWEFDEQTNEVSGFRQLAAPHFKLTTIPMAKGLLFRTRVNRGNPEGRSLLRNAYRPYFFKKHFEEIEGIGIERDLAGFPVLQAPDGLDIWSDLEDNPQMAMIREEAETLVRSIRRDSEEGIVLPNGWDLKLLASGSSRQINIGDTIDRYDNRIAITMLADIVLIGQKTGSFALASTKESMLAASLESQVKNIADVFNNNAVPRLFQMNGETMQEYPKIVPSHVRVPAVKEMALLLRAMGLKIAGDLQLQNFLRQEIGAPLLSENEFNEIYAPQAGSTEPDVNGVDNPDDAQAEALLNNDFEQNDLAYTEPGDGSGMV
jgi:hypothetical protein